MRVLNSFNLKRLAILIILASLTANLYSINNINQLENENKRQVEQIEEYRDFLLIISNELETKNEDALELREQIESLEDSIENYMYEISELSNDLQNQKNINEKLSQVIQTLESQIKTLQEEITQIEYTPSSNSESTSPNLSEPDSSPSTISTIIIDKIGIVSNVIDGDTFDLSSGKRIRLADIDAPEIYETGYTSSKNKLISIILDKTVYLDVDDIYQKDIYGRWVCVVYISWGTSYLNVNYALVSDGYAVIDDYENEFNPLDWKQTAVLDLSNAKYETPEPEPEPEPSVLYVASINSDVFHYPNCSYVNQMKESNKIWFSSRQEAIDSGRRPCSRCKP